MVNEQKLIFDENIYPIAWRFNSTDCNLSDTDKRKIIFLLQDESTKLWDSLFPFKKLMGINENYFILSEKEILDFDDEDKSKVFFQEKLESTSLLIFFWGRSNGAITSSDVLINSWSDFFYPSDEDCIIYLANKNKVLFSYEETFFYGDIKSHKK